MMRSRHRLAALAALALAACATPPVSPPQPVPITPPAERPAAPVAREPIPSPPVAVPTPPAAKPSSDLAFVASEMPPGTLYVCVSSVAGKRQQVAIAFDRKVETLCRKHPEMGPCQYERNVCRASGGRVYTAAGTEITTATEAEYDKKVLRVRFRAD